MSQNKKLKVAMQLVLAVSAAGVATVLHNAPASATVTDNSEGRVVATESNSKAHASQGVYTTGTDAYAPTDYNTNGTNAPSKDISGEARAQILTQITTATAGVLDFGKVVPTATAGTIVINQDGTMTNTGGARYIPNSGAHVATLSFAGQANQNIDIDVPSSVTISNGASNMDVTFTYPTTLPDRIGSTGTASMNYGGTLAVNENQAAGIYSGTYNIQVTYVA